MVVWIWWWEPEQLSWLEESSPQQQPIWSGRDFSLTLAEFAGRHHHETVWMVSYASLEWLYRKVDIRTMISLK